MSTELITRVFTEESDFMAFVDYALGYSNGFTLAGDK
jgi:hypothetical protein